jgi:hypothetical protein
MFDVLKRFVAVSLVFCSFTVSLLSADAAADLQEVHKFQLTEKRLDQFAQAMRNMADAAEKNPEAVKNDNSVNANSSINDMVAAFDRNPLLKKSVEAAGMTTREFVLFQAALFSAAMGHYVVQQGQKLPPEISADHVNVKFYTTHEAKFKALQQEWQAIDKKMKALEGDDEEQTDEENQEPDEE